MLNQKLWNIVFTRFSRFLRVKLEPSVRFVIIVSLLMPNLGSTASAQASQKSGAAKPGQSLFYSQGKHASWNAPKQTFVRPFSIIRFRALLHAHPQPCQLRWRPRMIPH